MDITIDLLLAYSKKHNLKFECYTELYNASDRNSRTSLPRTWIGIEMNRGIWYWWRVDHFLSIDYTTNIITYDSYDSYTVFYQRYSQISGQKASGFHTGYSAERKIWKSIGQ